MVNFILCFLIAFAISVVIAPFVIKTMSRLKCGQNILEYVDNHKDKQGTPTMGGVIFVVATVVSFLFFVSNNMKFAIITILAMLGYGLLGFLDDYLKVRFKHNEGLKPYQKVIGQLGIAILISIFVYMSSYNGGEILLPFVDKSIDIGIWIIPFVILVFVAVTNSVNLTDGLDGLASGVSMVYMLGFSAILGIYIAHITNLGEGKALVEELSSCLTLCGGFVGGLLGFFLFNSNPAKIFMGDTGSLAIGGFVASICILTKFYLLIPILGILFVISSISVIMQVLYYKATKKRIFLMAPIHHHFERKGIKENKIVVSYMIITTIVSVISILLYLL